ncbi:MAG: hypothetical protein LBP29_06645, partial [Treponema sp.]|nr:hypothetical protein [Treponema sp.]
IHTDGKHRKSFSCSCPSDHHPCKHISIVERAIAERIAENAGSREPGEGPKLSVEDLLKKLTREELCDFMVRLVKNNPDLTSAVFLEFAEKIEHERGNKYVSIIRRELANTELDEDEFYNGEEATYIDALDQWAEKAEQYLEEKKPHEAVLIAQAYIEEFAPWLQKIENTDLIDWIPEDYQSRPFKILEKAAAAPGFSKEKDVKALYDYCMAEVSKEKYAGLYMADCFNNLLMILSVTINPEAFVELQQKLLGQVQNKSSYGAEKILQRLVDFYTNSGEPKKAWKYVEDNIQIDKFRKMVVEKRIKQKKYTEAKKLVHDYLGPERDKRRSSIWDTYLLQIAQGEKDIPAIRSISYSFIKYDFNKEYYGIYKSAFSGDEWTEEFEKLFRHYEAHKHFGNDPTADLLAAEGKTERLMEHIRKRLSLEKMENYYSFFAGAFPEKTLDLFRTALDQYTAENTGRSHYEHILEVFRKMEKIPGGAAVAADMKARYLISYKNRRAMIEILTQKQATRYGTTRGSPQ